MGISLLARESNFECGTSPTTCCHCFVKTSPNILSNRQALHPAKEIQRSRRRLSSCLICSSYSWEERKRAGRRPTSHLATENAGGLDLEVLCSKKGNQSEATVRKTGV